MSPTKFNEVVRRIEAGEELKLIPDPKNEYDAKAINVYYKEHFIGYVPRKYTRKGELFNRLEQQERIYVTCDMNRSWFGDKANKMFFDLEVSFEFISEEELEAIKKREAELKDETEKPYDPNIVLKRNSWDRWIQAYDLENRGYIDNAIEIYETLVKRKYDNPGLYEKLAAIYDKRKEYQKAVSILRQMVAIFKKSESVSAPRIILSGEEKIEKIQAKMGKNEN